MKHLKKNKVVSGKRSYQKQVQSSLIASLIMRDKIVTNLSRAKVLRSAAEKLITQAKKNNLASRRLILKVVPPKEADKLITVIAPRYREKKGGYLRLSRLKNRFGDNAPQAVIEFT
ncbi:MAG: 50S ribosomal protein L17 [Patescibacteria group bacterium]